MPKRNYTYRSIRDERQYGPYWYSGLWQLLRPLLVGLTALLVAFGLLSAVWNQVYEHYIAPVEAGSEEPVAFTVSSGQSLSGVSRRLESAGLVRSATVFKYYCDFSGFGQKIQAGDYVLTAGMTMGEIADRLTSGDGNPLVRNITLIPGWTVEEFAAYLTEKGIISGPEDLISLCRTGSDFSDYYYVNELLTSGKTLGRRYVLEGYLAPDTYEIYTNASAEDIVKKLLTQTERIFSAENQDRAEELGLTVDQVLTLASLIEKEGKTADFTKVSAVFHNRLRQGMPLGSDVSIHYITGGSNLSLSSEELAIDSPYNTYKYAGLPVGPVCSPSTDAINAALWPDETYLAENYLFFCAKEPESGELYFSRTQQEHDQAVAIYAPLWQAYDQRNGN